MLTEDSVRLAIAHLGHFGDTDLFPRLPELRCFVERATSVVEECAKLNVGQYSPISAIETLTPKSASGFRIAHQLTASDNIIYLATALDCTGCLEASRVPREDGATYAYRYETAISPRTFEGGQSYHQWRAFLTSFASPANPFLQDGAAIITDISDFYQRIYFHRIENVLAGAGCPKGPSDLVKKIIKTTPASQSYGLPVGTTASRLIAECVLNDTDRFLQVEGIKSTRYVDDFRIAVPEGAGGSLHTM